MIKAECTPSKQEIEEHMATHMPFRSWCPFCVAGKAVSSGHHHKPEGPGLVPVISIDYAFMGKGQVNEEGVEEGGEEGSQNPLIVLEDDTTKAVMAHMVPRKGADEHAVMRIVQDIKNLGYKKVIFKSDQEPAILALKEEVRRMLSQDVIMEASPVGESQSNGREENAVRRVKGQLRTIKEGLDYRYGARIPASHPVLSWIPRQAAATLTRYSVGKDGRTPYQRWKGKRFKKEVAEFGECVWYLRPRTKGVTGMMGRWSEGIWLGVREETGEAMIGTKDGVMRARTVRRKASSQERWNRGKLDQVTMTPWNVGKDRMRDEDIKIEIPGQDEEVRAAPEPEDRRMIRRRFQIRTEDVKRMGETPGCPGCKAAMGRGTNKVHTEVCRSRFEDMLVQARDPRIERWMHRLADEMEAMKEREGAEDAARRSQNQQESEDSQEGHPGASASDEPPPQQDDDDEEIKDAEARSAEDEAEDVIMAVMGKGRDTGKRRRKWSDGVDRMEDELRMYGAGHHVTEIYSPPRVTVWADKMRLAPGLAFDLTQSDPEDGKPWDFNDPRKAAKARRWIEMNKPLLLIGSPMCAAFSQLNNINFSRMSPEDVQKVIEHGTRHLEFCMQLYRIQMRNGLYFLHEHPAQARSWKNEEVRKIMNRRDVKTVEGDMCAFGMQIKDGGLMHNVKKRTKFMTNASRIARRLSKSCSKDHDHIRLEGGSRTRQSEVYPEGLCKEIIRGLKDQMRDDGRITSGGLGTVCTVEEYKPENEEMEEEIKRYWDDISGKELDPELVKRARVEEIEEFNKHRVYVKVPIEECIRVTGKKPIGSRWVDINKGDENNPEYRSRLVAKEIKKDNNQDLFAATPPLEAKKLLMSLAMTEGVGFERGKEKSGMRIDFIDVRRAYFYSPSERDVFVDLPEEDYEPGMCGKLVKSMYGTRDAARNWEKEYTGFMRDAGFKQGLASPCAFYHQDRNIRAAIHGDDFTLLGHKQDLDWFRNKIKGKYSVKFRGRLGPGSDDDKSIRILNRIAEWREDSIRYEADQRHAELIVKHLGLGGGNAKAVTTPGQKRTKEEEGDEEELASAEATKYRALTARAMFLAQDRTDIGFAVKELSRRMSKPRKMDMKELKRLGRYLIGKERMILEFKRQDRNSIIDVWTDTDYAGCQETRKSTSGGNIMLGSHMIKGWSTTQAVIALSSGEAEYYGLVRGSSIGIGMKGLMKDLGCQMRVRASTDSSAALGISKRRGLGKVRHIELNQLWLQEKVNNKEIEIRKVRGEDNVADALTKHVDQRNIEKHMQATGQVMSEGRHELAPGTE